MENKTLMDIAYWAGIATPPIALAVSAGLGYLFGERKGKREMLEYMRIFGESERMLKDKEYCGRYFVDKSEEYYWKLAELNRKFQLSGEFENTKEDCRYLCEEIDRTMDALQLGPREVLRKRKEQEQKNAEETK